MSMIVGAENYDRLFLGAEFSEVDDKILYVFAPSESLAAEIEEQFSLHLSIVAGQVMFDEQDTAPGSASLSVCGKGLEHHVPSFFGSPAEDDVRHRSDELVDVVPKARDRYGLAAPVALDYAW
jgi:hypothetical protein